MIILTDEFRKKIEESGVPIIPISLEQLGSAKPMKPKNISKDLDNEVEE